MQFTHLDDEGAARMVDVTAKQPSARQATAQGSVTCSAEVVEALRTGAVPKGDVLAAQGKPKEALAAYEAALNATAKNANTRELLEMKIQQLK